MVSILILLVSFALHVTMRVSKGIAWRRLSKQVQEFQRRTTSPIHCWAPWVLHAVALVARRSLRFVHGKTIFVCAHARRKECLDLLLKSVVSASQEHSWGACWGVHRAEELGRECRDHEIFTQLLERHCRVRSEDWPLSSFTDAGGNKSLSTHYG